MVTRLEKSDLPDNRILRLFAGGVENMLEDKTTTFYFLILVGFIIMGIFGPYVAPFEADETVIADEGGAKTLAPPDSKNLLGTTWRGYDVLSRILIGARRTVITGLLGGGMIVSIGVTIGVTAGFIGGRVENVLMRITDFFYGVPLIPFAIVLISILGVGHITSVLVIGAVLWRGSARVIRSQVLQIKEYPYIKAAKATGASTPRIIVKHILPNVASMAIFFFAFGIGYSILVQASLTFLGVANPFVASWGTMIRNVFTQGYMVDAWWWSIPPGLLISLAVLSTLMFGRGYESTSTDSETAEGFAG